MQRIITLRFPSHNSAYTGSLVSQRKLNCMGLLQSVLGSGFFIYPLVVIHGVIFRRCFSDFQTLKSLGLPFNVFMSSVFT
jgi:hypothetical protein